MAFGMIAGAIEYYENYGYYYGPGTIMDPAITMADHTITGVDIIMRPTRPY